MTTPSRRRPGSASPIKLSPQVEEVRTSTTIDPPAVVPSVDNEPTIAPTPQTRESNRPRRSPVETDEKRPVTFGLRVSLKKRAETAVLRTAGYEGGYSSMAALVDGALERELERLAVEFNNGEPFPRNPGGFRQGRPLGS